MKAVKALPLMKKAKWTKLSHVQQMVAALLVIFPSVLIGQFLQTFPPTTSPDEYPDNWWTLIVSVTLYGGGCSGCFYIMMPFNLYWLQILGVKRAAFEMKMKEQGKEIAKLDEGKKERFGKIVLEMARAKNTYATRALVITSISFVFVIVTQSTVAFSLSEEEKLSSSPLKYGIAVTYLGPALSALYPVYQFGTLGRAAVYLYNKKSVRLQFFISFPILIFVATTYFLIAILVAFTEMTSLTTAVYVVCKLSSGLLTIASTTRIFQLLKIPLRSKAGGGFRSPKQGESPSSAKNRRNSTDLITAGLASKQSRLKCERTSAVKVAPDLTPPTTTKSSVTTTTIE